MAKSKKTGMLLLGILLIALGVLSLISTQVSGLGLVLQIFSIVTGVVIIIALGRVKGFEEIGMLLLGIWLILSGLLPLLGLTIPAIGIIMTVLAIAAGVLILIALNWGKITKNIGKLLLGIFLIIAGLSTVAGISAGAMVTPILAIVAGIFILIER
jgi:hypothetical protein